MFSSAPAPAQAPAARQVEAKEVKPERAAPAKSTLAKPSELLRALASPEETATADHEARQLFTEALTSVYNTHPVLKAEREALKATDETAAQAISEFRPSISSAFSRGRVNTDREDGAIAENRTLNVSQPVFDGLSSLARFKSAKERIKAGQAQLTAVEQQVLLDAITAYSAVVNSQALLHVNQNNVDLLNRQFLATRARFDTGEVTRTDLGQAEARLAVAKASERQSLGTLEADRATFRRVVGFDAPEMLFLPPEPDILPGSLREATAQAELNEPTLAAAQKLEAARISDVEALKGSLLPSVNLTGSMRRVENTIGGSQAVSNDSVFLNLTVPLYQSGAEWSRVRQAKHLAKQAKFTAMDTKLAVTESVGRAWQLYVAARDVIASASDAAKAASSAVASITQESRFGSRTILDVLNTQQELFNAQVSLVNARVNERLAAYRLLAATGRLTAKDIGLAVASEDPNHHYDKVKYKLIGF